MHVVSHPHPPLKLKISFIFLIDLPTLRISVSSEKANNILLCWSWRSESKLGYYSSSYHKKKQVHIHGFGHVITKWYKKGDCSIIEGDNATY